MRLRRSLDAGLVALLAMLALSPLWLGSTAPWPAGLHRLGALALAALVVVARSTRPERRLPATTLDAFLLVGLPVYALAIGNGRLLSSGDNLTTRFLAPHLLTSGTFDLSGIPWYQRQPLHYSALHVGDRILPSFPLGTALLSLPYSAVALVASKGEITGELLVRWEKHFSAVVGALSAVLFFLALRRRFPPPHALAATAAFALGTTALSAGSQAMYSTTGEVFFLCLALHHLLSPTPSRTALVAAGLALGGAFACRPSALLPALALCAWSVATSRPRSARILLVGSLALSLLLVCAGNVLLYSHPLGGYALLQEPGTWGFRPLALLGSLVSPSRGLLVYCPFLLLVPFAPSALRLLEPDARAFWVCALVSSLGTLTLASLYVKWWGGYGIGPRLLTEATPFLAILTLPLWAVRWSPSPSSPSRALPVLVAISIATQLLSIYRPAVDSWNRLVLDRDPSSLWSLRHSQLAAAWLPAWRPPDAGESPVAAPPDELTGSLDAPTDGQRIHGPLSVVGWARIQGEDLSVVVLVDGEAHDGPLPRRLPRPDVSTALPHLGDCGGAGFELSVPFSGPPGWHRVSVVCRAKGGRTRTLGPVRFLWEP